MKAKFSDAEFNDGYLMLQKLKALYQPNSEAQFMRLKKELYSLRLGEGSTNDVTQLVAMIKRVTEQIDATVVTLSDDQRDLLVLSMAIAQYSSNRSPIQIISVTPNMTAARAISMLKE